MQLVFERHRQYFALFVSLLIIGFIIQRNALITLPVKLLDTLTLTQGILYEALPFIFLGVGISVAIQQFIKKDLLFKFIPKSSWLRRPMLSVLGMFLPVCECGNVPLARGLIAKGLKPNEVLTFLFAAPIINPITIYTTMAAFQFDNRVVIIRVLAAFVIANIVGLLFVGYKRTQMLNQEFDIYCENHQHEVLPSHTKIPKKIVHYATSFQEETMKLMPALVGGSLLAGIIQTTIPRTLLTSISQQPVLAILAMLLLAFVVSICANVDAFFALSLSSVFPLSAIVAFLVFGPMIDIKMLALLKTTFKARVLVVSSLFIFSMSLLTGLVVHYAL